MHRGAWLAESKEKALRKDALEKPPQKQPSQRDDTLEGNNPALNTMIDTKELKLSSSNCTRIRTMQVPWGERRCQHQAQRPHGEAKKSTMAPKSAGPTWWSSRQYQKWWLYHPNSTDRWCPHSGRCLGTAWWHWKPRRWGHSSTSSFSEEHEPLIFVCLSERPWWMGIWILFHEKQHLALKTSGCPGPLYNSFFPPPFLVLVLSGVGQAKRNLRSLRPPCNAMCLLATELFYFPGQC